MSVVGFTVVAVSRMLIHAHDAHQQAACGRPQLVGRLYELGCIVCPSLSARVACVRPSLTKS
jgi:hypothetical protein